MDKKYYIGLDIGTGSCGFCVTDENYNVVNMKGKDFWGVKLFDTAEVAQKRRVKRGARRRLQRQKVRLSLLQSLFENEVQKVDMDFFARLKASSFWEDDKERCGIKSKNSLFFDELLNDKKFFKKYPTIYHLRKELMKSPATDIRYLYLAIHNILKHRGNFLYDSFDSGSSQDFTNLFKRLKSTIEEDENFEKLRFDMNDEISSDLADLSEKMSKGPFKNSWLESEFERIFSVSNSNLKGLFKAISGGTVNAKTIFCTKENGLEFDIKLDSFLCDDAEYLEFKVNVGDVDECAESIIEIAKEINSKVEFMRIFGKNSTISEALVEIYEKHKMQLRKFKDVISEYYLNRYKEVFSLKDANGNYYRNDNYANYISGVFEAKDKCFKKCTKGKFYSFVESVLKSRDDYMYHKEIMDILTSIEQDDFLVKLRTSANSVIPYQINKQELEQILTNATLNFPFLDQKDDDGLTVKDKIISLLEFKIPYYVGPLSTNNSKNSWIVKKPDEKITPWNFDKVVDLDACENKFIERMQNRCTYLSAEKVLPKNSLLYSEFMVLQELNNIKVNGEKLTKEIKTGVINRLKQIGKISIKQLKIYLKEIGAFKPNDEIVISGIDKEFKANLNIYKNFNSILHGQIENNKDMVEDIIYFATLVSDKKRLRKRIEGNYPELSDVQIKGILGLKIEGWGRLSQKFLKGIPCVDVKTGEICSIIEVMRQKPLNLMEVLANYNINDAIKKESLEKITYEDISDLYCSPSVKRGVWQSVKIIDEVKQIMGCAPNKIFVEVTREDDKKGEIIDSRKQQLENIYKSIKAIDVADFGVDNLEKLKSEMTKKENKEFGTKLYLYFLQLGKCIYTGEDIDLDTLPSNDYDIDHIIPQSKIKDDSLTNLVLVKRKYNIDKSDKIIPERIISKNKAFWTMLLRKGLINTEKYNRLIRTEEYTREELKGFISRQLVTTNQSAKAVIDLLKSVYGGDCVVYSKASNVTAFRNCEFKFDDTDEFGNSDLYKELKDVLVKCRSVNNLHHAKDAYLNIVVGNVFNEKYSKRFYLLNDDENKYNFNLNNAFKNNFEGVFNKGMHLPIILKTIKSNTPIISFLSREKSGAFYKETIHISQYHQSDFKSLNEIKEKFGNSISNYVWDGGCIPLKSINNTLGNYDKYGSYANGQYAYFTLVSYEKKNKVRKEFVAIPIIYAKDIKDSSQLLECVKQLIGADDVTILIEKVRVGTILRIGSGYYKIGGNTGDSIKLHNFNQVFLDVKCQIYLKFISKYNLGVKNKTEYKIIDDKIEIANNRFKEAKYLTKEDNINLFNALVRHMNLHIYKGMNIENIGKTLKLKKNEFAELNIDTQIKVINGIMDILTGVSGGDLTGLGLSGNAGILKISKVLNNKVVSIINYSSTGMFKNEVKIN